MLDSRSNMLSGGMSQVACMSSSCKFVSVHVFVFCIVGTNDSDVGELEHCMLSGKGRM